MKTWSAEGLIQVLESAHVQKNLEMCEPRQDFVLSRKDEMTVNSNTLPWQCPFWC